ncbi:OTU domain-containing protein 6B [Oopsacas minuta]|uniref:OTU domain-containing protein 6B n=1 Tax=Oopsacas minuta TaxID=111878 RepID=A0AAV7JZD0_9METZ|nr:OTU domain-containing protein 6B [Oopsacas minuta]
MASADSAPCEKNGVKKSRAQKRRDKKAAEEGRINELIAELDMIQSDGDIEMEQLMLVLSPLNLKTIDIKPDGDCMYSALSHQLVVVRGDKVSVQQLRRKCAEYMRSNKPHFIQFMLKMTESFEEYCEKIAIIIAFKYNLTPYIIFI